MNATYGWSVCLLAAGACLFASLHSAQARTARGQESDSAALMKELSSDFTALEKEIRERNTAGVASTLVAFHAALPRMKALQPAVHGDLADEFGRQVERFGELLNEI